MNVSSSYGAATFETVVLNIKVTVIVKKKAVKLIIRADTIVRRFNQYGSCRISHAVQHRSF